jgi:hypothetical protein
LIVVLDHKVDVEFVFNAPNETSPVSPTGTHRPRCAVWEPLSKATGAVLLVGAAVDVPNDFEE